MHAKIQTTIVYTMYCLCAWPRFNLLDKMAMFTYVQTAQYGDAQTVVSDFCDLELHAWLAGNSCKFEGLNDSYFEIEHFQLIYTWTFMLKTLFAICHPSLFWFQPN